jgi:hypothetical protein
MGSTEKKRLSVEKLTQNRLELFSRYGQITLHEEGDVFFPFKLWRVNGFKFKSFGFQVSDHFFP